MGPHDGGNNKKSAPWKHQDHNVEDHAELVSETRLTVECVLCEGNLPNEKMQFPVDVIFNETLRGIWKYLLANHSK